MEARGTYPSLLREAPSVSTGVQSDPCVTVPVSFFLAAFDHRGLDQRLADFFGKGPGGSRFGL